MWGGGESGGGQRTVVQKGRGPSSGPQMPGFESQIHGYLWCDLRQAPSSPSASISPPAKQSNLPSRIAVKNQGALQSFRQLPAESKHSQSERDYDSDPFRLLGEVAGGGP